MKTMLLRLSLVTLSLFTPLYTSASQVGEAQEIVSETHKKQAEIQAQIESLDDKNLQYRLEIESLKSQVAQMAIYKAHLNALLEDQSQELVLKRLQMSKIQDTKKGLVPLMYQMIDAIEQEVKQTKIKKNQRYERIVQLRELMRRADVSDEEKYRRIMEVFRIELDYGLKLDSYFDTIEVEGQQKHLELVSIGKIALYARSPSKENYWQWNQVTGLWQPATLPHISSIDSAYTMANGGTAKLITLPLVKPKARKDD